jgi:hypothetical protein
MFNNRGNNDQFYILHNSIILLLHQGILRCFYLSLEGRRMQFCNESTFGSISLTISVANRACVPIPPPQHNQNYVYLVDLIETFTFVTRWPRRY